MTDEEREMLSEMPAVQELLCEAVAAERERCLALVAHYDDGGSGDVAWVARQLIEVIRKEPGHA